MSSTALPTAAATDAAVEAQAGNEWTGIEVDVSNIHVFFFFLVAIFAPRFRIGNLELAISKLT